MPEFFSPQELTEISSRSKPFDINEAQLYFNKMINSEHEKIDAAHELLTKNGYVFVGYRGTDLPGFTDELLIGHAKAPNIESETPQWSGLYVSSDLNVAHGYIETKDIDAITAPQIRSGRGSIMRIYLPKNKIRADNVLRLNDQEFLDTSEASLIATAMQKKDVSLGGYIIQGQQAPDNLAQEIVISDSLREHVVALPSKAKVNRREGNLDSEDDLVSSAMDEIPMGMSEFKTRADKWF